MLLKNTRHVSGYINIPPTAWNKAACRTCGWGCQLQILTHMQEWKYWWHSAGFGLLEYFCLGLGFFTIVFGFSLIKKMTDTSQLLQGICSGWLCLYLVLHTDIPQQVASDEFSNVRLGIWSFMSLLCVSPHRDILWKQPKLQHPCLILLPFQKIL